MRAALQTLARERHYQLLLVNGDGHLLAASHALPASVLACAGAVPARDAAPLFGSHYQTIQPFAPHQRMLSRALNGNAGLAGWNLVMLAPDGGLPSLLVAYRWPVTIGLGAVLASALLALRQAARAAKTLIANRAVRDGESAGWRAGSAEAAPGPDHRSAG